MPNAPHAPRLTHALRHLLYAQRVAALGTLDEAGKPFVSMVPYAIDPVTPCVVLHISGLAPHSRNLQRSPHVSVLVMQSEVPGQSVHALPRVTLDGVANVLQHGMPAYADGRASYLRRFPEAAPMTELGDFMFVGIEILGARHVAGFGAARSLDATDMATILQQTK